MVDAIAEAVDGAGMAAGLGGVDELDGESTPSFLITFALPLLSYTSPYCTPPAHPRLYGRLPIPPRDRNAGEPPIGLRSVAEVREAETRLSDELHAAQRANAMMLEKLAAVKSSIDATETLHTHHLHGKVRYLCQRHTGVG